MEKTNGINTPGGRPGNLETPPSSMEVDPMDPGEGQLFHSDPSQKSQYSQDHHRKRKCVITRKLSTLAKRTPGKQRRTGR